jgi:hypothetical protein
MVMWREPEIRAPLKSSGPYSLRHDIKPGISCSANGFSARRGHVSVLKRNPVLKRLRNPEKECSDERCEKAEWCKITSDFDLLATKVGKGNISNTVISGGHLQIIGINKEKRVK